jgi:hypothetical protein
MLDDMIRFSMDERPGRLSGLTATEQLYTARGSQGLITSKELEDSYINF